MSEATMFTDEELREQRQHSAKPPAPINPFGVAVQGGNASAVANVSRAVAEVQAAMLIAKQFPRNEITAMDKILNAFTRVSLCEVAQYEYAKGGTDVRGPSIRAIEAIAQRWGNIHCGVDEIEQRPGWSTIRVYAYDAESGFQDSKVFQVEHLRYTRNGSYRIEDPRDIYEHIANQGARRKRAALIAVIPGDVIEAAMHQADVTLKTKAEVTTEGLQKLLESFAPFGVNKEAIEKRIQRRLEAMTPAQLVNLRKVFNSLRDGMSAPSDWFEIDPQHQAQGASGQATGDDKSKGAAAGLKEAASKAAGVATGQGDPPKEGENTNATTATGDTSAAEGEMKASDPATNAGESATVVSDPAAPKPEKRRKDEPVIKYEDVAVKIVAAMTIDKLNEARDLIRSVPDAAHQRDLNLKAADREKQLRGDDGK